EGDYLIHVLVPDPAPAGLNWSTFMVLKYRLCRVLDQYPASGSVRYLQTAPADIRLLQEIAYGDEKYVALPPSDVRLLQAADHGITCTGGPRELFQAIRHTLAQPVSDSDLTWAAQQRELPGVTPDDHSQIHLGVEWHWHSVTRQQ